ncbi:MAG TPA: hypothetical protein PK358_13635 [Spirochaetota bacterium]|nr:hypothetical protein [Spirochaetota bacterium]HPJ35874.1 hypothetical protein [Spirochaetota bacterium]
MNIVRALIAVLVFSSVLYAGELEVFERIEFRGARNLDRYGIIRKSGARVNSKGVVIDTDSLKDLLESNIMVRSSTLSREGNKLIVEIDEKYPLYMTLMVDKQQSVPVLLDEKMNIIESGLFFKTDMPIIILSKDYAESAEGYKTVTGLFELLKGISSGKPEFTGEMDEITVVSPGELKVKLRKRKTLFVIKNELNGFVRLEKTAAYLDAAVHYPGYLDLRGNMALIR